MSGAAESGPGNPSGSRIGLIAGNGTLTSHHSPSDDQPDAA